jgi:hypothetical protein
MTDKPLDVYLNDHLAGATFGADLAEQLSERTAGTAFGAPMDKLAAEIQEDLETLRRLMDEVGTTRNPVKQATTWLGEKLSRIKLSGMSAGEGELGLFLALETLSLGVEGKAALWSTLADVGNRYPPLGSFDFVALRERALAQRQILEDERLATARRAFAADAD